MTYFQTVSDRNNMALLMCNSARLLRIRAQVLVSKTERGEFSAEERGLYNRAADKYLQVGVHRVDAVVVGFISIRLVNVNSMSNPLLE